MLLHEHLHYWAPSSIEPNNNFPLLSSLPPGDWEGGKIAPIFLLFPFLHSSFATCTCSSKGEKYAADDMKGKANPPLGMTEREREMVFWWRKKRKFSKRPNKGKVVPSALQ